MSAAVPETHSVVFRDNSQQTNRLLQTAGSYYGGIGITCPNSPIMQHLGKFTILFRPRPLRAACGVMHLEIGCDFEKNIAAKKVP